jgi:type I restriction enzyme, S subunit
MSYPRYPRYKDSRVEWLGLVPEHWDISAVKRVAALRSGETITAERIGGSGDHPVFGGNGLRGYTSEYTHEGAFPLIGRQGALCGNVNYATGRFWASEHAIVATPQSGIDTRWLGEMLRAMDLNQYSTSAAQPGLSVDLVANLQTAVPPFDEQKLIADFLEVETAKIDALIAEQRRLIELLKEKRQAVISHAVTKGLDPNTQMKPSGLSGSGMFQRTGKYLDCSTSSARERASHTESFRRARTWTTGFHTSEQATWQGRPCRSKGMRRRRRRLTLRTRVLTSR